MSIFLKEIQKSFDLLDQKKAKQSSFITALEYMLRIVKESEYETEMCDITADKNGDIVIVLRTKHAQLTITASSMISYMGTGPREEDRIHTINSESYLVSGTVFAWIKRNSKQ